MPTRGSCTQSRSGSQFHKRERQAADHRGTDGRGHADRPNHRRTRAGWRRRIDCANKVRECDNGGYVPTLYYAEGSQHSVLFSYKEGGTLVQAPWKFTVVNDFGPNGHRYAVVLVDAGITWPDAKAAAESRGTGGAVTHLATITSQEEDLFLERLRQSSKPDREDGQLWVGGYQQKDSPDYWESYGGWVWVNNEGPIDGFNWGVPVAR